MPVNNRRSYSNSNSGSSRGGSSRGNSNYGGRSNGGNRGAASSGRKGGFQKKSKDAFNMLNLLTAFGDIVEWDGDTPARIKVRALLKTKDGQHVNPLDEQENEYDMREAVELLAEALLAGNGINFYLFLNDDGSYGGNGRINIKDITVEPAEEDEEDEEEEEVVEPPKRTTASAKRNTTKASGATKQSTKKTSRSNAKPRDYEGDIRKQADAEDDSDEEIVDESLPM